MKLFSIFLLLILYPILCLGTADSRPYDIIGLFYAHFDYEVLSHVRAVTNKYANFGDKFLAFLIYGNLQIEDIGRHSDVYDVVREKFDSSAALKGANSVTSDKFALEESAQRLEQIVKDVLADFKNVANRKPYKDALGKVLLGGEDVKFSTMFNDREVISYPDALAKLRTSTKVPDSKYRNIMVITYGKAFNSRRLVYPPLHKTTSINVARRLGIDVKGWKDKEASTEEQRKAFQEKLEIFVTQSRANGDPNAIPDKLPKGEISEFKNSRNHLVAAEAIDALITSCNE